MVDSIFKKNKALSDSNVGGGAIYAFGLDVLVLSSVFELNEASNIGGAARFQSLLSVAWYNNKELLFGNDALDCDGVSVVGVDANGFNLPAACFSIGDNF